METPDTFDLVTIITPIFNGEEFLSACIESVIGQTYSCWELILVDDGSTDSSGEICRSYAEKDGRISYIGIPHAGVSAARNAALEQARGEYIFFLDCDDIIHPQLIETQVGLMKRYDAGMAAVRFSTVDAAFQLPALLDAGAGECPKHVCYHALSPAYERYRSDDSEAIGGKVFCREVIAGLSFPVELSRGEDSIFIGDVLFSKDISIVLIEEGWYYRRYHTHNVTNDRLSDADHQKLLDIMAERIHSCQESESKSLYWKRLYVSNVVDWYIESKCYPSIGYPVDRIKKCVLSLLKKSDFYHLTLKERLKIPIMVNCFPCFMILHTINQIPKKIKRRIVLVIHSLPRF